jgi:hypothetical protein
LLSTEREYRLITDTLFEVVTALIASMSEEEKKALEEEGEKFGLGF